MKKKRGPRPGSKNLIDVPLTELIKLFSASANIKVGRKWIEAQGYKVGESLPPMSSLIARINAPEMASQAIAQPKEEEVSNLVLQISDPSVGFDD